MRLKTQSSREPKNRATLTRQGYTLVEVLVGATLLGFVATSLYAAFASGFCLIQNTREDLRATQIMMQKMEAVRLFTWSQVCDTNYLKPQFSAPYDPTGTNDSAGGTKYTGYLAAAMPASGEVADAYRTNLRPVT